MRTRLVCAAAVLMSFAAVALAEPPQGKAIFNGKDLDGWTNAGGQKPGAGWVVEDGAMVLKKDKGPGGKTAPGGDIWTKDRFGNFILDLEFKTTGNSGIFVRTDNPRDNVQTGIEIQVDNPGGPNKNSVGAFYDCMAPTQDTSKRNEWNRCIITCQDNIMTVVMNGTQILQADLNQWDTARKNPDGTPNKFNKALKEFKREGHIGLQDHGAAVAYRNAYIKPIAAGK